MRPMTVAVCGALVVQLLAGASVGAHGRSNGKHHEGRHDDRRDDNGGTNVNVHVVFTKGDAQVIREYYAPQHRNLPPGLRKKYAKTGRLPPGWQKKMQPMPVLVERRLPPLPPGYHRGVFDGHAVIYRPGGTIIDATVIF
jgi:hypothetical protein